MLRSSSRVAAAVLRSQAVAVTATRGYNAGAGATEVVPYARLPSKTPYQDLPKQVGEMLPEGVAGEINDDIQLSGSSKWMVREVTNALCNYIDTFPVKGRPEKAKKGEINYSKGPSDMKYDLADYSKRPEWPSCELNGYHYGTELVPTPVLKGKLKDDLFAVVDEDYAWGNSAKKLAHTLQSSVSDKKQEHPNKVLITGQRGVGKSTVLTQAVLHARANGWLCMFIPNGWDHVQRGTFIDPLRGNKGVYDNNLMSVQLLRNFSAAHKEQLSAIPLSDNSTIMKKYKKQLATFEDGWRRANQVKGRTDFDFIKMRTIITEESFPDEDALDEPLLCDFDYPNFKPASLHDLLLMGVAFRELAGLVAGDVVAELRVLDSHPVLLAVDQYNAWEAQSAYHYHDEPVHSWQIAVPRAMRFISKKKAETDAWQMKNGMCLAAVSSRHPEGGSEIYKDVFNSIPLAINVPAYNKFEFASALAYYTDNKVITNELKRSDISTFRTVTGSVGREVRREVMNHFFPLASLNVLADLEDKQVAYSVFGNEDGKDSTGRPFDPEARPERRSGASGNKRFEKSNNFKPKHNNTDSSKEGIMNSAKGSW